MDQRGTRSNRVLEIHHCLEDLVHDLDQLAGCLSDVNVDRRDGRDGVTLVEDLVARKDVVAHVLDVAGTLTEIDFPVFSGRKIGCGDHCMDTIEGTCLRCVDADDPRMGVRTAQDLPEQEAVQIGVATICGTPGHLVHAIVTDWTRTYDIEVAERQNDICAVIGRNDSRRCGFPGGTINRRCHFAGSLSLTSARITQNREVQGFRSDQNVIRLAE